MKQKWPQFAGGILLSLTLSASATVLYVNVNSAAPTPPYTNWSTAAGDIQSAVDAAAADDTVLVTNGTYATGGRTVNGYALTNRVVINKAITVQSVNGPSATVIQGYQVPGTTNGASAIRCVYMTNNATLIGFTVMNGATLADMLGYGDLPGGDFVHEESGGGVWCEAASAVVSNCVVTGNWAFFYGGGGIYGGTLNNCTLTANWAAEEFGMGGEGEGGGAYSATLNNCLLAGNSGSGAYNCTLNDCTMTNDGGAYYCTVNNCTLIGNPGIGAYGGTLSNCTLTGNSSGGAAYATLNNCLLASNAAESGAGAYSSTLNNCTLTNNATRGYGGGAYLSTLNNCTLTGNSAWRGGGAYGGTLTNCTLTGNSASGSTEAGDGNGGGVAFATVNNCILASNEGENGGGAYGGTLNNCTLTGNLAEWLGGGAYSSTLNNCTLTANSIEYEYEFDLGGGANSCTLANCIIYFNTPTNGAPNYDTSSVLNYCCTTPLPSGGIGNFTNAPIFVNEAGGDFHLQTSSPCINAGNNAYAPGATDLDGNPRIVGGTVDMGAYEFQFPTSVISYQWLQYYGLPTDGSADYADMDGSGMNNWQDWIAGTNPTNAATALRMLSATGTVAGVLVTWTSVTNRSYSLERATNLGASPAFWLLGSNMAGLAGATTFTDTNAVAGPHFYRVRTQQ